MSKDTFSTWAIVELFGHQKMAGKVDEYTIGSSTWVRVSVPATERQAAFDRLLNPSSIYAINPVSEEVAIIKAKQLEVAPIEGWELPEEIKQAIKEKREAIPAGNAGQEDDDLPY